MKEAIILAGGLGSRLKSLIPDIPKPMVPINGIPFLTILLEQLINYKFSHVILSVYYNKDYIKNFYGKNYKNLNISYSEDRSLLGTGGAIKNAMRLLIGDYVCVLNGDTFLNIDLNLLINFFHNQKQKPVISYKKIYDTTRYGTVELVNDRIEKFSIPNQSLSKFANMGCYILNKTQFDEYPKNIFSFESDFLINDVIRKHYCGYNIGDGFFIDIGIPSDYLRAQSLLKPFLKSIRA